MADRTVDEIGGPVPTMDEILSKLLQYVILDAKDRMEEQDGFTPFVAVAVKDNLFLEEMDADEPEQVYAQARHTVADVKGADAYALCYDGYIETDAGTHDAIMAEGGVPGADTGYACGMIYEMDGDKRIFMDKIAYVGKAPNYMANIDPNDKFVPRDDSDELIGYPTEEPAEQTEE